MYRSIRQAVCIPIGLISHIANEEMRSMRDVDAARVVGCG